MNNRKGRKRMDEPSKAIMKHCAKCDTDKPEEAFEWQPSRGYRRSECRECKAKSDKAWREKRKLNPPDFSQITKQCKGCGEVKSGSEFSLNGPGILRAKCKGCEDDRHKAIREAKRGDNRRVFYPPFTNEHGTLVKKCSKCDAEKPIEDFYENKGIYRAKCKVCESEIQKRRRIANPEKYREMSRKSAREHRETRRNWVAANREHMRQYARRYRSVHRDKFRIQDHIRNRDMKPDNPRLIARRTWYQRNPEKHAAKIVRYRTRKMDALQIDSIDRNAIIERDKWTCYLCGKICTSDNVTLDHVVPLFLGGAHTSDNLRVACRSCNCSKGAKPLAEFLNFRWESA